MRWHFYGIRTAFARWVHSDRDDSRRIRVFVRFTKKHKQAKLLIGEFANVYTCNLCRVKPPEYQRSFARGWFVKLLKTSTGGETAGGAFS